MDITKKIDVFLDEGDESKIKKLFNGVFKGRVSIDSVTSGKISGSIPTDSYEGDKEPDLKQTRLKMEEFCRKLAYQDKDINYKLESFENKKTTMGSLITFVISKTPLRR